MRSVKQFIFNLLLLFLLLIVSGTAVAQDNEPTADEVNDVAKGLYCPVCESTPLDVCPTQACADWRELIREQLASGMSKQEIYDYFAVQYGDGVLAEPPRQGFSLVLWFSPIFALLIGGFIFIKMMRQLRVSSPTPTVKTPRKQAIKKASPIPSTEMDSLIARVEAELQELSNG